MLLVAEQVAVLFVLMGVGAICREVKILDESSVKGLVQLLLIIVTPSIVIDSFQCPFDPTMLRQLFLAFALAIAAHLVGIALSKVTARGDADSEPVLRFATVLSNAGFMGLPLQQAILGPRGIFYGIVYVATFNVVAWSWGICTMRGKGEGDSARRFEWRSLVNPGTIGLAIALPLFLFSKTLPEVLAKPIHFLGELNTPVAMLIIGYYLMGVDFKAFFRRPSAYVATVMRLVVLPLIVLAVLYLLKGTLDYTMSLAILIASSAPVAAITTMFAARFKRDVDLSVALVSGTTLLSILTMPLVITLGMKILH